MSEIDLRQGDSLKVLKKMPENSIDSIVCDPPYGISFMGKDWDKALPPTEIWEECIRVLKPGGYLIAMSASRTFHRLAVQIEDLGMVVHPMIGWIYGCLTPDTYAITETGKAHYKELSVGQSVLCYDKDTKEYSYQKIEEMFEYEVDDFIYNIKSGKTNQLVTKNHRCLVERNGREAIRYAETLLPKENVPVLENLRGLQGALRRREQRPVPQGKKLFKNLREQSYFTKGKTETGKKPATNAAKDKDSLPCLQQGLLSKQKTRCEGGKKLLLYSMQWQRACEKLDKIFKQRTWKKVPKQRAFRGKESCMEGRSYLQAVKGKLCWAEIREVPKRIFKNVAQGWLCYGAPVAGCATAGADINADRSCSPRRPQHEKQFSGKLNVIQEQQRPQKVRAWGGHKTTLADVSKVKYKGKVWCIKVSTGLFVAERDSMAFVTGNSGFPKATDLSKQFDKAAGAKRTVIGPGKYSKRGRVNSDLYGDAPLSKLETETAPSTDQAKKWNGWKYGLQALKPAMEPCGVFQKPHLKPMIKNVEKYGVGAMNIDATRVEFSSEADKKSAVFGSQPKITSKGAGAEGGTFQGYNQGVNAKNVEPNSQGRHPANLIHDGSESVEREFLEQGGVRKNGGQNATSKKGFQDEFVGGKATKKEVSESNYSGDTGTASRFFNSLPFSEPDAPLTVDQKQAKENQCQSENTNASNAESNSSTTLLIERERKIIFVQNLVMQSLDLASHCQDAKYVQNIVKHIVIKPVQELVQILSSGERENIGQETRQATREKRRRELLHNITTEKNNLARFAGKQKAELSDTTKTIQSLEKLIFCANLAISEFTPAPFNYVSKASKRERNEGLEGMPARPGGTLAQDKWSQENFGNAGTGRDKQNFHPTVKPIALMEWLVKLVTPIDGTCLDPFMGSGTTGIACVRNYFSFIGIEREQEFYNIAKQRIEHHKSLRPIRMTDV